MRKVARVWLWIAWLFLLMSACRREDARTVVLGMWAGDEQRNRYFESAVAQSVQSRLGLRLRIAPLGDTADAINKLLNEKRAGKTEDGSLDVLWINGENFRTAREAGLLWGPIADRIPNARQYEAAARLRDFGTAIDGWEVPWQKAQFVMAYDTARVKEPPRTWEALREWVRVHPGQFTYVAPPDFTGSAFVRHLLFLRRQPAEFVSHFDEGLYREAADSAIGYLKEIRPYLWRRGETYPASLREQDRLFANSEIDFAMSYGPAFASERIGRGEFPPTVRTFVWESGTLSNYSYLAVPFNARNREGALAVVNELLSFEQAVGFSKTLGATFPLALEPLTAEQNAVVAAIPRGVATLPPDVLAEHALPEPHSEYLVRFEKDWQEHVLRP